MAKKRKKMSAAEKMAFVKRMRLAREKRSRSKTGSKKRKTAKRTISKKLTGVTRMAKKRRNKVSVAGKSSRRSSRRKTASLSSGNIMKRAQNGLVMISGGILAALLANKLPIGNKLAKSLVPVGASVLLMETIGKRQPMVNTAAMGMLVVGGLSALRAQFPSIPLLAGEGEIVIDTSRIPYRATTNGIGTEQIGTEQIGEDLFVTAANI